MAGGGDAGGGEGEEGGGAKAVPMHRLFAFADRRDAAMMAVGGAAAVVNGLAMPFLTFLIGDLVDAFGAADRARVVHVVSKVAVRFVYVAIASGVSGFLQVSCWMVTGERQAARIRGLYLETILRQDISFFDAETSTGEIIERMTSDTVLIQEAIGEKVGKFLQLISQFLGGFIIAFARGWLLSLVMLSSIPPVVISAGAMSLAVSKLSNRSQMAYAKAGKVVEQTIGSIRTLWVGCMDGSRLTKCFATIYRTPEIDVHNKKGLVLENFMGDVELRDVHFSYPTRPGQSIFSGFSITIRSGTTMALVGESGSGKSTIISLVERFYDPQSGEVLLDGVNLKLLNLSWIRQKIALVSQEPILFTTTIRQNIEYGKKVHLRKRSGMLLCLPMPQSSLTSYQMIQTALYAANSTSENSIIKPSFDRSMSRHSPQDGSRRNSHTFSSNEHATIGGKLIERIRALSFTRVVYQEIGWFDDPTNSRLSADAASIRGIAGDVLSLIVQNISTAIVGIVIAMVANWKLACIVICFVPCVFAQSYAQARFMRGSVPMPRTVASFGIEDRIIENYRKKCEGPVKQGVHQGAISGAGYGFSFALLLLLLCCLLRSNHDGRRVSQSSSLARDFSKVEDAAASILGLLIGNPMIDASSKEGTR
ncbi:hypothetical protein HU200_052470 [Digitaria exilis]|uniref:Uncharacterized protein n=1 Tax=Digitaria exilis TaxID=1010633 RepID=A0A835ANL8_9POAL|nr:hypothetical protein HU200_052470 [Digitaria exilis]